MIKLKVTADIVVEKSTGKTMQTLVREEPGKSIMESHYQEGEVATSETYGRLVLNVIEKRAI